MIYDGSSMLEKMENVFQEVFLSNLEISKSFSHKGALEKV